MALLVLFIFRRISEFLLRIIWVTSKTLCLIIWVKIIFHAPASPLPNGVIHHNMPLSTTNILIVSVSIPYRFRINPLSFPYQSLIVSVSFSYCSPIGKRKQYGNNTETIRNRTENERMRNGGTRVVNLTIV